MKKKYIIPLTTIETIGSEMMLAASKFDINADSQVITPTNEEYDGEFSVKGSGLEQEWDW